MYANVTTSEEPANAGYFRNEVKELFNTAIMQQVLYSDPIVYSAASLISKIVVEYLITFEKPLDHNLNTFAFLLTENSRDIIEPDLRFGGNTAISILLDNDSKLGNRLDAMYQAFRAYPVNVQRAAIGVLLSVCPPESFDKDYPEHEEQSEPEKTD